MCYSTFLMVIFILTGWVHAKSAKLMRKEKRKEFSAYNSPLATDY